MENASKALIMAGGILLAMMILALIIYVTSSMTSMQEAQEIKLAAQQLQEFNNSYLIYNKTRMYGTDIISVTNKADEHNRRLDVSEEEYKINIIIKDKTGRNMSISYESEFKTTIFKCESVEYSQITGRVNSMTFTQI